MADDTKPCCGLKVTREELAANRAAGVKRCFRCHEAKPFDCFATDKSRSDGLQPRCKACTHELYEIRRGTIEKRVPFTEEEKKARRPIYAARYRVKNKEKLNKKSRDWMAANKDHFEAYAKQWRIDNAEEIKIRRAVRRKRPEVREKRKTEVHNRRAYLRKAEGFHTTEEIVRIREQQGDRCAHPWCRKKLKGKGHRDHIIPLARGGTNYASNIQLLCGPCNLKKNSKDPIDHAQANGYLV